MTAFLCQLLAGGVELVVEEDLGHVVAVDGQAAHTRLDISTDGQEREAASGPSHACWTGSLTPTGGRERWTSIWTITRWKGRSTTWWGGHLREPQQCEGADGQKF